MSAATSIDGLYGLSLVHDERDAGDIRGESDANRRDESDASKRDEAGHRRDSHNSALQETRSGRDVSYQTDMPDPASRPGSLNAGVLQQALLQDPASRPGSSNGGGNAAVMQQALAQLKELTRCVERMMKMMSEVG